MLFALKTKGLSLHVVHSVWHDKNIPKIIRIIKSKHDKYVHFSMY